MTLGETISKANRNSSETKSPRKEKSKRHPLMGDMLLVSPLGTEQIPSRRKETVVYEANK